MQHLLFLRLLPLLVTATAAAFLRHFADLDIDVRSKHGARESSNSQASEVVTIELKNYKGVEYTGAVSVGGQTLRAIYDTGSYDIMAVSDHCMVCHVPKDLKVYRNKSSKTFKKGKDEWQSRQHWFAGGMIMARQDFDTVSLGSKGPVAKIENMPVWQVEETTLPQWTDPKLCKFTTIVGLGYGKVAPDTPQGHPPVAQLLELAGTQHFSICLQKGKSNPGYITLNAPYDFTSSSFTSMFRHLPVVGKNHWGVENKGVSYFNAEYKYTDSRCAGGQDKCVAIIDSGTSLIGVPSLHMAFIQEFAAQIKLDCSNLDKLPALTFDIGGHKFPLPASAYVLQMDGKCYAAFQPINLASDLGLVWVLGLPFLRHYYTVWDRKGPSLYIAEQGDDCKPKAIPDINASSSQLLHAPSSMAPYPEPTIGDIREARLPSFAPHGTSEQITI